MTVRIVTWVMSVAEGRKEGRKEEKKEGRDLKMEEKDRGKEERRDRRKKRVMRREREERTHCEGKRNEGRPYKDTKDITVDN